MVEFKYLLVYSRNNFEIARKLFVDEHDVADDLHWIQNIREKQWFSLKLEDNFEESPEIVAALQKKQLAEDEVKLAGLRRRPQDNKTEIKRLEQSLDDQRRRLPGAI